MPDPNLSFTVTVTTEQVQAALEQLDSTINDSMTRLTVQMQQASTATGSSVQKMVKGIGDASKDIAKSFDEAGVKASGTAQIVGGSLSAIPNPYAQAAGALISITDGVKNSLLQLDQAAQQSHMGTVQFVELKDAMEAAQMPAEHLPEILGTLSSSITQAAQHSGAARSAFQQLGISTDSWKNRIPSTDEVLLKLADHLKGHTLTARESVAVHSLLGDRYKELLPLLQQGSAAIREQMKAHEDHAIAVLGGVRSSRELEVQEQKLSEELQTLLLPVFQAIVKVVEALTFAFLTQKRVWQTQVDAIVGGAMEVFHSLQGLGRAVYDVLHGRWSAATEDIKAANKRIQEDAVSTVAKVTNDWAGFGTQFKSIFAEIPPAAKKTEDDLTNIGIQGAGKRTAIIQLEAGKSVIAHRAADEQIVSDANAILGQLPGVEQNVDSKMLAFLTQYSSNVKVVFSKTTADIELGEKGSLERRRQQWGQFFQSINSAFSSFTKGLLSGHQTLAQAWSKLVDNMASAYISSLEKQLMAFLQNKIREVAIHAQAEATKDADSEASHAKEGVRTARSAAQHAYDAVVDTPIIGPILAPLAAAAAFAAVAAFGSAEGGQYLVPGPQLTMLHPQEMVLPAGLASRMRDVVEGRTAGGGGGVTVVVNHSVNAVDAESFQGTIRKHSNMIGNEVARVLRRKGFVPA